MIINNLKLLQFDSLNLGDNNLRDFIYFLPVGLYKCRIHILLRKCWGRIHTISYHLSFDFDFYLGFVPASKMRLRRGLGYPTQITVPYVFTVCNPTLQKKIFNSNCNTILNIFSLV